MAALNQNGFDFYGFSPEAHAGEERKIGAPKYAVWDYLTTNKINPQSAWAGGAASALNKQFNTNQFQAKDDETLLYGDEYVHSGRPGGPGQTGSLSNPGGTPAFTWGSTPAPGQGGQPQFNAQALQNLLRELAQGGAVNPFQAATTTTGASGTNPFLAWLKNEQNNPRRAPAEFPTVATPQGADLNAMIEQALMRAFLGG